MNYLSKLKKKSTMCRIKKNLLKIVNKKKQTRLILKFYNKFQLLQLISLKLRCLFLLNKLNFYFLLDRDYLNVKKTLKESENLRIIASQNHLLVNHKMIKSMKLKQRQKKKRLKLMQYHQLIQIKNIIRQKRRRKDF